MELCLFNFENHVHWRSLCCFGIVFFWKPFLLKKWVCDMIYNFVLFKKRQLSSCRLLPVWKTATSEFGQKSVIILCCFKNAIKWVWSQKCYNFVLFWRCGLILCCFGVVFIWFNKYLHTLLLLLFLKNGNKWLCWQKCCFGVMV